MTEQKKEPLNISRRSQKREEKWGKNYYER